MTQLQGMGLVKARRALAEAGDVDELLRRHAHRLPFPLAELPERWREVEERTHACGGRVLTWDDVAYPPGLAQLVDAPPLIFSKGQTAAYTRPLVAVVGTRRCTDDAARWAHQLGAHIAAHGATLVSGLAMGVDIAAMRGALEAGGSVVACLGHGLERIHPKGHRRWAEAMLERGAWITEYPADTRVDRWHFAHRNRIVAGLAAHTFLVQSPAHGGGMITARLALEYDRELTVGEPRDERAVWDGNRHWIEQGAPAVRDVEAFDWMGKGAFRPGPVRPAPPAGLAPVWAALQGSGGCSVDALAVEVEAPTARVRRQLLALELGGWVRRAPGGWFVPVEPSPG